LVTVVAVSTAGAGSDLLHDTKAAITATIKTEKTDLNIFI